MFQTLHCLSTRAIAWLLKLLGCLLTFFGRYSNKVSNLARAFPSTLHSRNEYLNERIGNISVCNYVVCQSCLSVYKYEDCIEQRGARTHVRACTECKKNVPLLKEVITSNGNTKFYPYLVYPYASLISSLKSLLLRKGFYHQCQLWYHTSSASQTKISDVYDGEIWSQFFNSQQVEQALDKKNGICFMLNVDWFQPYKHRIYSIGVLYLEIMNLPRSVRFKRENIIIIGLIPGPSEPKLNMNSFLSPLVSELLLLWDGIDFQTHDAGTQNIRGALLCIGCDLPAGRKVCGFLGYNANLGCTRCYQNFGTGVFGKQNYSGFDKNAWNRRDNGKHRKAVESILKCKTKTARSHKESELGCRYSCLLQLSYFDPVRMLIIDPMHNLYLGTAKYIFNLWIERKLITPEILHTVNKRVGALSVPPDVQFGRLPACLDQPSSLTAEQWMLWVNYYSVYCLYGLISTTHLECWRHFVLASRLLCRHETNSSEIQLADALLMRFCHKFEDLYGKEAVRPNTHLHAHLTECVRDYGPMSSFWLFAFERFNGILGNEPTNNRSIEIQLMTRFLKDNAHLELLLSVPPASDEVTNTFSKAILDQVCSFTSVKHLDSTFHPQDCSTECENITPAKKYKLSSFSEEEMKLVSELYSKLFPSFSIGTQDVYLPQTFKKMDSVSVGGNKLRTGLYILAKPVFDFPGSSTLTPTTAFSYANARPAKIEYFVLHSVNTCDKIVTNAFAVVNWPAYHPAQHHIGKPFEVWCYSVFENNSSNHFLPVDNFVTYLLTAPLYIEDEKVLVTVSVL